MGVPFSWPGAEVPPTVRFAWLGAACTRVSVRLGQVRRDPAACRAAQREQTAGGRRGVGTRRLASPQRSQRQAPAKQVLPVPAPTPHPPPGWGLPAAFRVSRRGLARVRGLAGGHLTFQKCSRGATAHRGLLPAGTPRGQRQCQRKVDPGGDAGPLSEAGSGFPAPPPHLPTPHPLAFLVSCQESAGPGKTPSPKPLWPLWP